MWYNRGKIYVAGHNGLLGSAVLRRLKELGSCDILTRSRRELDLTRQEQAERFFCEQRPDYVILATARVGGIDANIRYPADFIYDNIAITANVIHSAYKSGTKKLLFFGSACSYPRDCPQPIREEYLLNGKLEPTNEAYAAAKIAGIKMVQAYRAQHKANFICAVPTNIYGLGDNFDKNNAHVIPALLRRFHEAKLAGEPSVSVWGSGNQRREFMSADDAARASLFLMERYDSGEIINIGTGRDISIKELAAVVKKTAGYEGEVVFDTSRPDGMPRKFLDVSKINALGWEAKISLEKGMGDTYRWYLDNFNP